MEVALKIDVDTHQGLKEGVPRLRALLRERGVSASFFIAMGPDNSGRAILRMFRNPGFLTKMRRTNAVAMYGLRTVLSGTLLPSRPIATAFPELLRQLVDDGFEVGVHGWDHVRWQDHIDGLGERGVAAQLDSAFDAYEKILGTSARSFAAPGWRTNANALRALDRRRLSYRSDTRGSVPFRCMIDGEVFATPEIPSTLPTLDEVMGTSTVARAGSLVDFYLQQMSEERLNVHTIHAETEGMGQLCSFGALLAALQQRGARFRRLDEVAATLDAPRLPTAEVARITLDGRAGWVAGQAAPASGDGVRAVSC